MIPGVIADLETQLVKLRDLLPVQESLAVFHPAMSDKEGSAEAKLAEQRRDKLEMRSDAVIKGENDRAVRYGWLGGKE